jgi:cyclopropane fatty-acyl-phospholipid synthase-like methyltransferase
LSLTGVDLSPNTDTDGIKYIEADIHDANFNERFDVVVNLAVIEHVASVKDFTRELVDLSNPGGKVFVMTLNESGLLYRIARVGKKIGFGVAFTRLYSVHHLHHFSARSLYELMRKSGLTVDKVHYHNAPLKRIDYPTNNKFVSTIFMGALVVIFAVGRVFYGGYLQTIEARNLNQ